jgi:hypothetical protein
MSLRKILNLVLFTAAGLLATVACQAPEPLASPAAPDYKAVNGPAFDTFIEVLNTKDYDKINGAFAESFRRVAPDQNANGREEMKSFIQQIHAAYPDFHIVIGESVYAKDLSFNQWTVTGSASLEDGTAQPIEVTGVSMIRYADGMITEEWVYFDTATLSNQLGMSTMPHVE